MMERGQSLFELVIAIAISAIIIVALVSLAANSIRDATFSKNKTLASRYAQETTEWLRGQRDAGNAAFFDTYAIPGRVFCFQNLAWTVSGACTSNDTISQTPFIREVSFPVCNSCPAGLVEVDVTVTWTDAQGDHVVQNSTSFSDPRQQ